MPETESNESARVEVYRLRVARGNQHGGGSGGDWTLYEGREDFEEATLKALIEEAAHGRTKPRSRAARWWQQHMLRDGKDVDTYDWTVCNVFAAEQFVDGEWVDLGASLVPPSVRFASTEAQR